MGLRVKFIASTQFCAPKPARMPSPKPLCLSNQNLLAMKLILILFLTVVIVSCGSNPYNCSLDNSILDKNDSIMQHADFKKKFTPLFEYCQEPELESLGIKSYRLFVTYTWDRDKWIYRFEKTENGGMLTIKKTYTEIYKENSNFSDTIIYRELSMEKWKEIENIFDSNCFWTLPVFIDRRGLDGQWCILEAFDPDHQNPVDKEYFIAARWSPEEFSEVRTISDYIETIETDVDW